MCLRKVISFFTLVIATNMNLHAQTFEWRLLANSPGYTGSNRFEDIFFIDPNTGWIINYNGLTYKTTDAGINWTMYGNIPYNRSIGYFDSQTGILGTLNPNFPLMRTTNGGINYSLAPNLPSPEPKGICGISIVNENVAYACGRYYIPATVLKTTDKGMNWTTVFSDSSLAKSLVDCYFWTADSGIAVGGYTTTNNFDEGNAVIIKTTNGGATWQRVHRTLRTGEWCWKISFFSRDSGYVSIEREIGGPSNVLKTTDKGSSWTELPFVNNYDEEGIGFINETTGWVGGWTGPTYKTTNAGASWQLAGWGTNMNRFRFLNDTLAYAVGDRVYKYSQGPVGIQTISNVIPVQFSIDQNFPNPFNPGTKIKFDIPSSDKEKTLKVKIIVFDILGKDVATLIDERLTPGSYETQFDGSNLPGGIYFYKIETSEYIQTKKMILLK